MTAASGKTSITVLATPQARDARRRVAVVVLGMHRSGTSAVARMLNILGCALPATLLGPGLGNVLGHWESDAVGKFNDEVLEAAGTCWNDWLPVNPGLAKSPVWPSFVARGRALLDAEYSGAPLFVLKDPRICRLAGFWLEVLDAEGIEPAIVIPVRNPLEVARSLRVRDGVDEGYTLLTWLRHVLDAEASTRGRRRIFSHYDDLLDDWQGVAARMERSFDIAWPRVSPTSALQVEDFLAPDHRHHEVSHRDLGASPGVSRWVSTAYDILRRWGESGVAPGDYKTLDAIAAEFDTASVAFARPLVSATLKAEKAARLEAERDAALSGLATAERAIESLHAAFDALDATSRAAAAERDAARAGLAVADGEILRLAALHDAADRDRGEAARVADEAAAERDDLRDRLTHTETRPLELRAVQDSVEAAHAAAMHAVSVERDATSDQLLSARADVKHAYHLVHLAHGAAVEREAHSQRIGSELERARAEADACSALLGDASERADRSEAEVETLRTDVRHAQEAVLSLRDELDIERARAAGTREWVREVHEVLEGAPRWWRLMPAPSRRARERRLVESKGLFDAQAYLDQNPDVAAAELDPLRHYMTFGVHEGRRSRPADK